MPEHNLVKVKIWTVNEKDQDLGISDGEWKPGFIYIQDILGGYQSDEDSINLYLSNGDSITIKGEFNKFVKYLQYG